MSFRKGLLIIVPAVLVLSAIIYGFLGGYRDPTVTLVALDGGYRLAGKPYIGTLKDPALKELLDEVGAHWESGTLPGVLTVAILKEPIEETDTVEQFIGVLLPAGEQPKALPDAYEIMEVPAQQAVRASLKAHASVWPSPDKLRDKAENHARENGLALQPNILFEKYYGPEQLEIEIPLVLPASVVE